MLQLDLQIACEHVGLPSTHLFERWAQAALEAVNQSRQELTIRITEQEEIHALNRTYREKDKPTNVLSFPFESIPGIDDETLGDIVICKSVVESEANEQNVPTEAHWAHLVIHGILHLCGYDHISDEEADQMETLETSVLSDLGYANPYNNE